MVITTFKGCNIGFILAFLANFNVAQSIHVSNIFDGLFGSGSAANAEQCTVFKNRRKCFFSTTNLKLDSSNILQLVASVGGRTIKCSKILGFGKDQWYGSCDGDADDANFIAHFDKDGKKSIYGSIHVGDEICRIGPNIFGEDEILCTPRSEFKAEDDALAIPNEGKLRTLNSDTKFGFVPVELEKNQSQAALRGQKNQRNDRVLVDDSGDTIDTMVVWTKLAECRNAGLLAGCILTPSTENVMRGLIDLAIAETNTAYALSGIFTSLRLVHAYRDSDYEEGDDMYAGLEHITTPNDGFMDSAHSKRALYGADMVQLISGAASSCGIAWSGEPTINYMFSATQYSCATGYYSFGHEIGHTFGMFHDQGTEKSCSGSTSFNYGYRQPNAEFRTMLSYDCKMGECDSMPKNGCPRVQRFSNSDSRYTYNGKPIGNAKSDNAKQFNQYRSRVAAYFPAMNCRSDTECDDNNTNTADTCNIADGLCVFTPIAPKNATPTRAPIVAREPISIQEQGGFFSKLASFFDQVLSWLGVGR